MAKMTDAIVIAFLCCWGVQADLATPSGLGLIAGKTYVPRSFCRVAKSKQIISTECVSHLYALKILSPQCICYLAWYIYNNVITMHVRAASPLRVEASKRAQGSGCVVWKKQK